MSGQSGMQRRSAARTAVVWDALRAALPGAQQGEGQQPASVVDIGGGTGGLAVRVAGLGHRVTVVDPSPDALAAWTGGPTRAGSPTGSPPCRATSATCPTWSRSRRPTSCSATACWRSSTTPRPRWPRSPGAAPRGTAQPAGRQRHAAVVTRAMAGHFAQARALADRRRLGGAGPSAPVHRRRDRRRARRCRLRRRGDARRAGLRRPGAQLAGRPRARCRPRRSSSSSRPWPPVRSTSRSRPRSTPWPPVADESRRMTAALPGAAVPGRARPALPRLSDPARRHGRLLRLGGAARPARAARRPGRRRGRPPRGGALGQLPRPGLRRALRRCR